MSDKPIIFDSASVQGILADRITMTFRPVVPQPTEKHDPFHRWVWHVGQSTLSLSESPSDVCPVKRYCVGDILWVKEAWGIHTWIEEYHEGWPRRESDLLLRNESHPAFGDFEWKPPACMPKGLCRIRLEVVDVRVLRIQDATDDDCFASGIDPDEVDTGASEPWGTWITAYDYWAPFSARWDDSYARRGYELAMNPWVYAIAFRRER